MPFIYWNSFVQEMCSVTKMSTVNYTSAFFFFFFKLLKKEELEGMRNPVSGAERNLNYAIYHINYLQ